MKIRTIAALAAAAASFAPGLGVAQQGIDMAAMQKWAKVQVVHYEAVGEFRGKHLPMPPVDADLYGDVVERVNLSFDWDRRTKVIVGSPRIRNEPAVVSNLEGIDKKCPAGKLNGAVEHFEVDEIKQAQPGQALELVGRRVHPDTLVTQACGSKPTPFKGAVKPAREFIAPPDPEMLVMAKMMSAGGPFAVTPDGKSIVMKAQNSNWTWTFTPTPK